jgi:hypothetical protein
MLRRLHYRRDRLALIAAERHDRRLEVDAVEMLHEVDDVAASSAASAIPYLFFDVDGEAIFPAAYGTGADTFTATDELDPAARDFVLDPRCLRSNHAVPPGRQTRPRARVEGLPLASRSMTTRTSTSRPRA